MTSVATTLHKADKLLAQLVAAQPPDPLAHLTDDQRIYYKEWWARFKLVNSATPAAFYAAAIDRKVTPADMFNRHQITAEMDLQDCASLYRDQLGH